MKRFLKVFFTSLICFSLVVTGGLFMMTGSDNGLRVEATDIFNNIIGNNKNERINVLLLGLEHERSDTIMIASYNTKTKTADIISIPRDTYIERDGFRNNANNKINTVYTVKGIEGLNETILGITGMKIDKYVTVDYDGVRAAVDAVGGVEVNVPFHMRYTDPYSDPPLDINIPEGEQLIKGDRAMEFLRFRKTNYAGYRGYSGGDLGRIEAQQGFIKAAIKKALTFRLPKVVSEVYPHVKTDFALTEATSLAVSSVGLSTDNINFHTLPGAPKTINDISFYIINQEETKNLVYGILNIK
ncbi:LCP family protein [Sedimentibacter hydroxybenzoicus DSM 7310]|uniref:LCP family protein n=1 Tax=Sedimentibacter hydroxybenzoicus DSM 7310 TaxID=1123245 RepID=A0A974GX99_SEDHY|nr:LCP family protein [Sedimentibacter hydroxybenzoicus]NYB75323.1 LCP family protein [Sedimentibacter hydroxybenzoicus DSM 7310]